MKYHTTLLEDWIEELYRALDIKSPQDLGITNLATKLDIWVYYVDTEGQGFERFGMMTIFIDRRKNKSEQWIEFLHELCHLLRHSGNQSSLPVDFVRLQESDADNFARYASMPYFMIRNLDLGHTRREAANILSELFCVPYKLAYDRLDQINNRYLSSVPILRYQ